MKVHHFCAYITRLPVGEKLIGDEWDAMKLVKAIKGDPLKGYATIHLCTGGAFRLEESSRDSVFDAFANHAMNGILSVLPRETVALVPVPSSKSTVKTPDCSGTPTHRLTAAIAKRLKARVVPHDMLRWAHEMASARNGGGTRDPRVLLEAMRATKAPSVHPHVLIDDMLMSGGHLQAAKARIEKAGGKVLFAICVAKTIHQHTPGSAFTFDATEVADYTPNPFDWSRSA